MRCPNCRGTGEVIVDESHNDICGMCDGLGCVAAVKDDAKV